MHPFYGQGVTDHRPRFRNPLAWLGDHLFGAILSALVALALGAIFVTQSSTTRSAAPAKTPPKHVAGRVHVDSWPDGVNAWTVVLASASTRGLAESALNEARRVPSRGLNLGVLRSDDYVDLRPGYWVAFAGQFDEVGEAQAEAERYRGLFPSTYQRFIEEKRGRRKS